MRSTTIYREVGTVTETCEYGCDHDITYYDTVDVTDTGETRVHDNGYQFVPTPLYSDANGRVYHQHVAVDLSGNISYVRDGDNARFSPRTRTGLARRLDGTGLNNTPDGKSWFPDTEDDLDTRAGELVKSIGVSATPERLERAKKFLRGGLDA